MSFADSTSAWASVSPPRPPPLPLNNPSPPASDNDSDADEEEFVYDGSYSAQMDELLGDDDDASDGHTQEQPDVRIDDEEDEEEDEDEDFVYSGVDASNDSFNYRDQLRDVLSDHEQSGDEEQGEDEDEEVQGVREVEKSLIQHSEADTEDEPLDHNEDVFLPGSPSVSISSQLSPPSRISTPEHRASYLKLARPYLHPTVSRLRSYTPSSSPLPPPNGSPETTHSHLFTGSPVPSGFSSLSRVSSTSNLHSSSDAENRALGETGETPKPSAPPEQDAFRWTDLQSVSQTVFSKASQKALSLLGTPTLGTPTTLTANGLICIGTTEGKVVLHDFKQTLVSVCESNISAAQLGPVTALAMSHDHTYVVSGHSTGYVVLYNLKTPRVPARVVAPTTLSVVLSGRKEGHLIGSRIVSVGFVAGRHTGIVSADEKGLAFFHSLGKVLFMEATDILRILGKYPDPAEFTRPPPQPLKTPLATSSVPTFSPAYPNGAKRRTRYTILSMAPLPLGTIPHPTDTYHVVALLTPTKLVVVGLKPVPRTWFKCPREVDEGGSWNSKSKWTGTLAWFPSVPHVVPTSTSVAAPKAPSVEPRLAYAWGKSLHILEVYETRTKQLSKNRRSGKTVEVDVGIVNHRQCTKWVAEDDILAMQWLNANQLILFTAARLVVYDVTVNREMENVAFESTSLLSLPPIEVLPDAENDWIQHSMRVYKGKVFLLQRDRVSVGALLTWADKIIQLVQKGDFINAIKLTQLYYTDEAPGNRNNLPDDPAERRRVISDKLKSLMTASAQYAFSEDRLTDHTHRTPDNRGVDRTSLFEELVQVCCQACIALDDTDFLFEDLFQKYDDNKIAPIYLRQLEPFILNNGIRYIPPRITQQLVALHARDERADLVERIIWHIDPACLDLNQTILLCQRYQLYDALIYIYTRALRDYVAPIVELLGLIRKIQQYRRAQVTPSYSHSQLSESAMEATILNAYKIYPYLANVLSGLTHPSEEPLPADEAFQAKKDIYTFLFFGRSSTWPPGEGGKLVLTADEEGGVEPTYPYARQLLLFDSEAFLHSLDIAFEDSYLHDETQAINRLMIIRILMEIMSDHYLPQEDITFVNIFIARNVPKYTQFLQLSPSNLHTILVGLAQDPDRDSKEDRQLAAEYLLSVYNPHDLDTIAALFEEAGFYRILRTWYRQERKWAKVLSTYVDDPDVTSLALLDQVGDVITTTKRANKGIIPTDIIDIVEQSLPRLLHADPTGTATLLNRYLPNLHQQALDTLGPGEEADRVRFDYLKTLVLPDSVVEDSLSTSNDDLPSPPPRNNLPASLREQFISLHCRFAPSSIIRTLQSVPDDTFDQPTLLSTCEKHEVFDAVIWWINKHGEPQRALSKADEYQKRLCRRLLEKISDSDDFLDPTLELKHLENIGQVGRDVCLDRSQASTNVEVPLEDMWFQLLSSQIRNVQTISSLVSDNSSSSSASSSSSKDDQGQVDKLLNSLRELVQKTFGSLVSVTSTSAVSFPRLFKRLVNSTPSSTSSHYTEFRIILTGMLESYRSDEDLLLMLKHLLERDLFSTMAELTRERTHGWAMSRATCQFCRKPFLTPPQLNGKGSIPQPPPPSQIVVSRSGAVYHTTCRPTS